MGRWGWGELRIYTCEDLEQDLKLEKNPKNCRTYCTIKSQKRTIKEVMHKFQLLSVIMPVS